MTQPWKAEIPVDQRLAKNLIERQFPRLKLQEIKPFGQGWDNTAFLVNHQYIFRFPRRHSAVPLLERELKNLPYLAKNLEIPIPMPEFIGQPCELFPYPFGGYQMLAGHSACQRNPSDAEREKIAAHLGKCLAALHQLSLKDLNLPGDELKRACFKYQKEKILAALEESEITPIQKETYREILAQPFHYEPRQNAIVHGDLYARHLLLNENNELCGLIDWGDLHQGDPAADLSIAWTFLPERARNIFCQNYGHLPEDQWFMAKVRAMRYGLVLHNFGKATQDESLYREALRIIAHICKI